MDIIKTLPTMFARGHIREFLAAKFVHFYFTLGRGRPQRLICARHPEKPYRIYFTHQGLLLGYFRIREIVKNAGQLPPLTTLDGKPSAWQIKPDRWVAVCDPPFHRLHQVLYHEGFRGWRYFELERYAGTPESKVRL